MVNNYVKLRVIPPSVKKRYSREHLTYLIMICVLKTSLPMGAIRARLSAWTAAASPGELYDRFCGMFETAGAMTADGYEDSREEKGALILRAALRAGAERAAAPRMARLFQN